MFTELRYVVVQIKVVILSVPSALDLEAVDVLPADCFGHGDVCARRVAHSQLVHQLLVQRSEDVRFNNERQLIDPSEVIEVAVFLIRRKQLTAQGG